MTTQSELRDAIDYMKSEGGKGSKKRKQERFRKVYTGNVGHIVCGERYDNAGVGPATAESAVENVWPEVEVDNHPTISEAVAAEIESDDAEDSLQALVEDLDAIADESGNDQQALIEEALERHREPSLVTLALLGDESIGLGTSQMREAFFDGSRSERKRAEALCDGTVDFITRARNNTLPTEPEMFTPFDPQLAKSENHMPDDLTGYAGQLKYDGYRLTIHVSKEPNRDAQVEAYSRNRKRITQSLYELQEIDWPDGSYIFDGEVIAEDGTYKSTSERIGTKVENIDRSVEMEFALFDLIHANGEDYTTKPYRERHDKLHTIVMSVIRDPRVYVPDVSTDIQTVEQFAAENDYEGIILKKLDAEYELGTRSDNWIKSKNRREHVDVRVVDVVEGSGEATGQLGKFIVESSEGEPLGGVGTGFSDQLARRIWRNPDDWIGGTIEVSAESYDPSGDGGLRFPVYERDRRADGEPDSIDKVKSLLDVA